MPVLRILPRIRPLARTIAGVLVGGAALAAGLLGGITATPAQADILPSLNCTVHEVSVAITDPGPADQTLWGQLCYRGQQEPNTVQFLVHGATYSHTYWDFPYGHGYYSYVNAATLAGYATFNVDRIGVGNSSHPVSTAITGMAGAVALHDAITALRTGAVDGHAFRHVIWVGHSLGSIIGWVEISTYHDVDAAILTGALHSLSPAAVAVQSNDIYPAVDDPLFANSGLDTGYLTTKPGTREAAFYYPPTADPNVVAIDEATKQTVTATEGQTLIALLIGPPAQALSQQITVPVLLVVGQQDALFCQGATVYDCTNPASVLGYESPYYSPQADLEVQTVPATGHDLALSTTAPITDAIMIGWSLKTVAP